MPLSDFPALVPGGEGLGDWPAPPDALRRRMAEVYAVSEDQVLPTRGATHGLELVLRVARRDGAQTVAGQMAHLDRLADIYGLRRVDADGDVQVGGSPDGGASLRVIDDSAAEFVDAPFDTADLIDGVVVLRSLSLAYGLAGARCGAAIATPATLARLTAVLEPNALPASTIRLAEAALSPSRALAVDTRIRLIQDERSRVAKAIGGREEDGPFVLLPSGLASTDRLVRFGVPVEARGSDLRLRIGPPGANDRILAAFGVAPAESPRRRGEAFRDTKETRIVVTVDLDRAGDVRVRTGVGFFDHMLEQVAAHGGFSLTLACEGDLHTDPHHTVEDSALALGAALKQALGDRAGIGRYGFVLPMDEAEAAVSLDLSGRPYAVFEGSFGVDRIGDYPTALTAHVFRSLAQSLGAAIHVRVTGGDDHHKTEACFKALGRALRQGIRVEGGAVPSTKGVL